MPTKLSRYLEGVMEAAWLAAIILVPLFFDIYSSRIFEPDKITLLRSLVLIILVAWVVKLLSEDGLRWDKFQPGESWIKTLYKIPLAIPVIALVVIYTLSTIFSVTPRNSLWGSYQRLQGTYTTFSYLVIFISIAATMRKRVQVERLLTILIITSLPISLYGILQHYQVDPVPWGGDTSSRIATNMGNSIFAAAYLIMVFPLTLGRIIQAFDGILHGGSGFSLVTQVVRGVFYVFTISVQIIAQYFTYSRGPALGLIVGLFLIAIFLSMAWRKRWLTYTVLAGAVVVGTLLLLFQIPNGPFEALRATPAIGRYGQLLNSESNNAKVREYIWQGAARMVGIHQPIQFPDGSTDKLNFLRPLIGYGPESMYVAYNPFYVPALGQVEKRNASPDRSHNETWDSLVITGVLGLLVYLLIFSSVFYYGLKWLGLICNDRQRNLFLGFLFAGGALGSLALIFLRGAEYFGVGLPFGMVFGVIGYVVLASLSSWYQAPETPGEMARSLLLIILLGAIVAHFLEINFGIAIAVTRLYFWTYSALLLVVGYILPRYREYESMATARVKTGEPVPVESRRAASRKEELRRYQSRSTKSRRQRSSGSLPTASWLRESFLGGGIIAIILATLGFDYISNPDKLSSALTVLWRSFTVLPTHKDVVSYGILTLILATWIGASIIWTAETLQEENQERWLSSFLTVLGISGGFGLLYWLWHSGSLVALSSISPTNVDELLSQIGRVNGLLTAYYVFIFLVVFALGYFIPEEYPVKARAVALFASSVGVVALLLAFFLINVTNLRVIHADIAFKMAEPFNQGTQWPVATLLYKQANTLAPEEDHYYLFLGRSYLEQAKDTSDTAQQNQLVKTAETDLKDAQRLNPLNTDHTANLGRLYSWWATRTNDPSVQVQRADIASSYYSKALNLSPNNSTLWGEWALLYMDVLHQPDQAYRRISHALSLDPTYNWTEGLMGDYYSKLSRTITDTQAKTGDLTSAIAYYQKAISVTSSTDTSSMISYYIGMGNAYTDLNQLDRAISAYVQAVSLGPSSTDLWKIDATIARLYAKKGDKANALLYANNALKDLPADQSSQSSSIQSLISQIQSMP